jgi:ABC-type sugar transport system ATPase subunit
MNMLAGIYYPDEGDIYVNGRQVTITSPHDAYELGIGMIHQHYKLVDVFTAAENIILGLDSDKITYSLDEVNKKVEEICSLVRIFVSYSHEDAATARDFVAELLRRNYDVWQGGDSVGGASRRAATEEEIQKTAASGFALLIVTEAYLDSEECAKERQSILKEGAQTVVVTVGEVTEAKLSALRGEIISYRKPCRFCSLPEVPRKEDVAAAMDLVEEAQRIHIKGPIRFQADFFNRQKEIAERLNYQKRYHKQEARCVHAMGAMDDYCEVWEFPCCGRSVVVGDGPVSRFRSDGCCREEENAEQ